MKAIPLFYNTTINNKRVATICAYALVDDEDWSYLIHNRWLLSSRGYAVLYKKQNNKTIAILMHRYILKANKGEIVDHKDHNKLNNQKNNIHIVNLRQNALNAISKVSTSGYIGVAIRKNKKYTSYRMQHKGISNYINAAFKCPHTAAHAYNKLIEQELGIKAINDLSTCGYTIDELNTKLITDRIIKKNVKYVL